jgi:isoamylase
MSWNSGAEGPTKEAPVRALRGQQMRNFMATLLLSQGVPMIRSGDELGQTQRGNNTVYCQDSELSWMDWSLAEKNADLLEFTKKVTKLRKDHPVFRRRRFFAGTPIRSGAQVRDIAWLTVAGQEMTPEDWDNDFGKCIAVFLNGEAIPEPDARGFPVVDNSFLLCFNGHDEELDFVVPAGNYGKQWSACVDTADPVGATSLVVTAGEKISLVGRSVLVLHRTA